MKVTPLRKSSVSSEEGSNSPRDVEKTVKTKDPIDVKLDLHSDKAKLSQKTLTGGDEVSTAETSLQRLSVTESPTNTFKGPNLQQQLLTFGTEKLNEKKLSGPPYIIPTNLGYDLYVAKGTGKNDLNVHGISSSIDELKKDQNGPDNHISAKLLELSWDAGEKELTVNKTNLENSSFKVNADKLVKAMTDGMGITKDVRFMGFTNIINEPHSKVVEALFNPEWFGKMDFVESTTDQDGKDFKNGNLTWILKHQEAQDHIRNAMLAPSIRKNDDDVEIRGSPLAKMANHFATSCNMTMRVEYLTRNEMRCELVKRE